MSDSQPQTQPQTQGPSQSAWKPWLHSLVVVAVTAFVTALATGLEDPRVFNASASGLEHIAINSGIASIVAVAALLKKSPLPS